MDRRNFLKLAAVGTAAAALPALPEIVEENKAVKRTILGNVEEYIEYDLRYDSYHFSHNVRMKNGDIYGVDQMQPDNKPDTIKFARKMAIELLAKDGVFS